MSSSASEGTLEQRILAALSAIQDPDLGKDIVALGFVKDLKVAKGILGAEVSFRIELTTPACPIKEQFENAARDAVLGLPGVSKVKVTMDSRVQAAGPRSGNPFENQKAIPGVKNVIAVASGKGGVGKSTIAVNLALALRAQGCRVGILDADIYGPSQAMMLGVERMPAVGEGKIIPVEAHGIFCMTFAFFAPVGEAVIWRGPMLGKAIQQMLFDVDWTSGTAPLDYLVVDMPPGTGDVQLSLVQSTPIAGAVIVSTPQDVALIDATRGLAMFQKLKIPVLGIIENMSGFICPHCGKESDIFGKGGAEAKALDRGVPFLGRVPLEPHVVQRGDSGKPIFVSEPENPVSRAFVPICKNVAHQLSRANFLGLA